MPRLMATVPALVGDVWAHCSPACAKTCRRRTEAPRADHTSLPEGDDAPSDRPPE